MFLTKPDVETLQRKGKVRKLIAALEYKKDRLVRADAARALGAAGDPRAVAPLILAIEDECRDVRLAAMSALGEIGDRHSLEPLTRVLSTGDSDERVAAVRALGGLGSQGIESLILALDDKEEEIVGAAAEILGQFNDQRVTRPLVQLMQNENRGIRESAVQALDQIGWRPEKTETGACYWITKKRWDKCVEIGAAAVEQLLSVLNEREWWLSSESARALGEIGEKRAVPSLIALLDARDSRLVEVACVALGQIGDKKATETIVRVLEDGNKNAKVAAAGALAAIGDPQAVEPLVQALTEGGEEVHSAVANALANMGEAVLKPLATAMQNERTHVRKAAVGALGKIGAPAQELLIEALQDSDDSVSAAAAEALGNIGGEGATEALVKALMQSSMHRSIAVTDSLDKVGWQPDHSGEAARYWIVKKQWDKCIEIGSPAVDPLITALGKGHWWGRKAAANALGTIGDSRAVPPLLRALGDEQEEVREAAAEAVNRFSESVLDSLLATVDSEDPRVRSAVVTLLGETSDPRGIAPLLEALLDRSSQVRDAAIRSLAAIGAAATEPLIGALQRPEPAVRLGVVRALGEIGIQEAVSPLKKAMRDTNESVLESVAQALDNLGWEPDQTEIGARYWITKKRWDKCAEIGAPALAPVQFALDNRAGSVRRGAVQALGKIVDRDSPEPLLKTLHDRNRKVREAVVQALDRIGWRPDQTEIGKRYRITKSIAERQWQKCAEIGDVAVGPLREALRLIDPTHYDYDHIVLALASCGSKEEIIRAAIFQAPNSERYFIQRDLFGDYGDLLADLCSVEENTTVEERYPGNPYHDHRQSSFSTSRSYAVIKRLCEIETPVSTNILILSLDLRDFEVVLSEACDHVQCRGIVEYKSHRSKAEAELLRRGSPKFNPSVFLDRAAWKILS